MRIPICRSGLALALVVTSLCWAGGLPPDAQATFPGKPGLIVFNLTFHSPGAPDYSGGLFAIRPGANKLRQLTENPWDYSPSFAPSGRRLVFERNNLEPGLFVLDLDSGSTRWLVSTKESDRDPAFGKRGEIAFARFTGHSYDLFLRTADGQVRRLTRTRVAKERDPVFSPDGERIFFVRDYRRFKPLALSADRTEPAERIYSIRTDGTGLRLIGEVKRIFDLDVSPTGHALAFEAFGSGSNQLDGAAVWTKHLRGGAPRVVTVDAGHPAFSPAGDEIAYWNYKGIWTVGTDGRGRKLAYGAEYVNNSGALAIDPAWQPLP